MASRSKARDDAEGELDVGEELEQLEQLIERCKVLYEQHFMGIQKIAPETLHRQAERRMIKLTQHRIRNTALRFRFTTLSQKFGSYNTYWRRTMRAIEQGRYTPHLRRVAQRAGSQGREIPDEMLAKMPRLLREKLIRDRDRIAARNEREQARAGGEDEPAVVRSAVPHRHEIDEAALGGEGDFDFDAMFDAIKTPEPQPVAAKPAAPARPAAPPAAARPAPAARPPAPPPVPGRADSAKEQAKAAAKAAAVARAKQKLAAEGPARPAAPKAPPRAVKVSQKRDSSGNLLPPGMTEHQTRQLYDRYVKAKKLVGEDTGSLSYAKLLRTLNKQTPRIMKQHQAKSVEFNVVIKDDAVVLKAKPKKG